MIGRSLGEDLGGARLGACFIKFDNDKVLIEKGGKSAGPRGSRRGYTARECTDDERTIMVQSKVPAPDTILSQ